VVLLVNHHTGPLPDGAGGETPAVQAFHGRLPGYTPSPLLDLTGLASELGIGRLLVKDESSRLGLPAFKILGASWATYRLLCERMGGEPAWTSLDELAAALEERLPPLRLVTATDGNHGRAVARMARLLRLAATILVPAGTAAARVDAIASEGAEVRVVDGTYDDAVAEAAGLATDRHLVVSDTSWPGYEDVPRWVVEGYSTIFAELGPQLAALGLSGVDAAFVPVGVGSLAAAAGAALGGGTTMLVGVEPDAAACVTAALDAGHVVEVPGPHRSLMAGLNCGLASPLAMPAITAAFSAMVTVDDDRCRRAIRALAAHGLDVGETGAAALAGLTAVLDDHRAELPLPAGATVLVLVTEGVTDPVGFEAAVGRPPR
jgi:diaminopropionate ammonia-lyase